MSHSSSTARHATPCRRKAEKAESTPSDTKVELVKAQDTDAHLQSDLYAQESQLDACASVVEMSDHQWEQSMLLIKVSQDYIADDFSAGIAKMDKVSTHTTAITGLIEDSGNDYIGGFWAECASEYEPI